MKRIMMQVFIFILSMLTIQCSDEAGGSATLGQPYFNGRISLTGGSGVVSADYNEDGIPDLAITRGPEDTMQVFIGRGDGTFEPPLLNPSGGVNPEAICTADFNKDGHMDIAVSHLLAPYISVFFGNGDGTCGAPVNHGQFGPITWLSTGDFNADGNSDILLSNNSKYSVVVLYGDGQGGFPTRSDISGLSHLYVPRGDTADFNGDGYTDIVVQQLAKIIVIFSDPEGSFEERIDIPLADPNQLMKTITGDLNGDGLSDILVGTSLHQILILFNNDGKSFLPHVAIPVNMLVRGLTIADINNDGIADIVSTGSGQDNTPDGLGGIRVFPGTGGGNFDDGPWSYSYYPFTKVLATDVNSDGIADLTCLEELTYNTCIMFGKGDGSFHAEKRLFVLTGGGKYYFPAVSDMNGDGNIDIIAMSSRQVNCFPGPDFTNPVVIAVTPGSIDNYFNFMKSGDLNHDGAIDLILSHGLGFSVYLNKGALSFERYDYPCKVPARSFDLNDLDGDGILDIVIEILSHDIDTRMYRGLPDGRFILVEEMVVGFCDIATGFLDDDNTREIVISASNGTDKFINIYKSVVDGCLGFHFQQTIRFEEMIYGANWMALKDVTGDEKTDLILGLGAISVAKGMGDGTFSPELIQTVPGGGGSSNGIDLFDFSGDGIDDIVIINERNYCVATMIGRGDGTFCDRVGYTSERPHSSLHHDFDGDGLLDILVGGDLRLSLLYAAPPKERTMPALTGVWPYVALMAMTTALLLTTHYHVRQSVRGQDAKQGPPPPQATKPSSMLK